MMTHSEWAEVRYAEFEEKIESFKSHPKYGWLRRIANDARRYNEGSGLPMIKAGDFISRIEKAPLWIIYDWLDGKNRLEWSVIHAAQNDAESAVV